jgi:NADPH2:quinone reductase
VIQGKYQIKVPPPFAPGGEGSGVVSAIGENVSGYAVGDRVLFYSLTGAFAEQIVIPAANAVIIPDEMPYPTAAGFLAAYGTGYYSFKQRAGL